MPKLAPVPSVKTLKPANVDTEATISKLPATLCISSTTFSVLSSVAPDGVVTLT